MLIIATFFVLMLALTIKTLARQRRARKSKKQTFAFRVSEPVGFALTAKEERELQVPTFLRRRKAELIQSKAKKTKSSNAPLCLAAEAELILPA